MQDLIYYTLKILEKNKEKIYFFSLFVSIFNNIKISKIEEIFCLLDLFQIDKVSFINSKNEKNIDQNKIMNIIHYLNFIENNKEKKITEDKMIQYLLFILILIDLSKSRFIEFLFRNNLLKKYLFKILLDDKKKVYKQIIFPELNLPNYIIDEFILDVKNYQDIVIIISYQKNFLEALDIINRFFEYMTGLIKVENNPKNIIKKIQFVNFIKPDKNDDLNKIKELLELLFTKEIKSNINILEISPELLIKYFQFHERNINELVYLYQIIIIISLAKKDINLIEIESLVHESLEQNVKGKKIKNNNLLIFIETAPMNRIIFYENILDNIDITKIDDKFMEKFKKINWCKILNISKSELVQKICKLIPNIKYFGKLFYLFDFNTYIDKLLINIIKERFIDLLEISSEEDKQNIIYDCSKFIYYLNIKNCDLDLFINNYIYKFFPSNIINDVYIDICSNQEYKIFKKELLNIIHEFYSRKENNNFTKSTYFIFEIEHNKNFDPDNLIDCYIEYNDFFDLNQEDKFSLLEKIVVKNLKKEKYLTEYIKKCNDEINNIIDKMNKGNVEFGLIKDFFIKNRENELVKRIQIITIFIDKYKEYQNLFFGLKQKIFEIMQIVNNLNIIKNKLNMFLKVTKKEEILKIEDLLNEIDSNNLDYCHNNKEQIFNIINQEDINELPLIDENSNTFFKIVYENTKLKNENELKKIDITRKKIKLLVKILNSKSNSYDYINKFNTIMNEFNEKQYKNLEKEIDDLILSVGKNPDIDINKDKMKNILKYIWKKDLIYNFSILFKIIIRNNNIQKSDFTQINEVICQYLEKPKNIKVIELSIKLYQNYQIEFIDDNNFELFKTIKLIKNMNEIASFIMKVDIKQLEKRIDEIEDCNYKDNISLKDLFNKLIRFKKFLNKILSDTNKDIDIIKKFLEEIYNSNEYKKDFIEIINQFSLIIKDKNRYI